MSGLKSPTLDVVYPLGNESKWNDDEIRYSLRSIEQFLPHRNVYIIGKKRSWMTNVIEVECDDFFPNSLPGYKSKNVIIKIKRAAEQWGMTKDFILMNDDFFFLRPTMTVKTYHLGLLKTAVEKGSPRVNDYDFGMSQTRDLLRATSGNEPLNFGVHYPMVINRLKFIQMIDHIDWRQKHYLFRSVYGNIYERHHAIPIDTDFKIFSTEDLESKKDLNLVSTSADFVLSNQWRKFISEKFPRASRYEY